jgi:hydroxymethylbilane synthase
MGKHMRKTVRVATRGSQLAMAQTHAIIAMLTARQPGLRCDIVEIATHGDRFQDVPIAQMGGQVERGIFNTALEEAVLEDRADVATCSFKDVESQLPAGLVAVSVGQREDPRDVLLTRHRVPLEQLPPGAVLATSSPRRISQLTAFRPDFRFEALRGNVTTRSGRDVERFDGVILAAAGLRRLGLQDRITQYIPEAILLPAPAQAAMGCEYAAARPDIARLVVSIQHPATDLCARLEKALLVRLSGGCFAPVGILARVEAGRLWVRARIVSLDGTRRAEAAVHGAPGAGRILVAALADRLIGAGAADIIAETREHLQGAGG